MAESQIDLADGELVSDFEFILPWDVIETCCALKPQGTSCFVSLNKQAKTSNQLFVSKLEDNSIKIRIRVVNIDGERNKESEIEKGSSTEDVLADEPMENIQVQEGNVQSESLAAEVAEQEHHLEVDLPGNNMETSTSEILDKMITEEQDTLNKNDAIQSNKSSFSEGLSTVIIVKKVSSLSNTQTPQESSPVSSKDATAIDVGHQSKVNKENITEIGPNKVQSSETSDFTVVKPRPTDKDEKKEELLNVGAPTQVTCELCFQQYESYSHLVRHVRKQHRDCTFVRNYLEEIRPLTIMPCPICKRNFTAKSSLDAHLKVSHGGQYVRIKNLPAASIKQEAKSPRLDGKKLGANECGSLDAIKTKIPRTSSSTNVAREESESDDDSDSSVEELANGRRVKCDVCNESFETRQQALKHQDLVHRRQTRNYQRDQPSELFSCQYCDKKLRSKELLLKHCLGTHFKSNDAPKKSKQQQSDSEDDLEQSENEELMEEVKKEPKKIPAKKRGRPREAQGQSLSRPAKKTIAVKNVQNISTGSASSPDAHATSGFVCDLCGVEFNRMTLLVTHARYCRKSTSLK